MIVKLRILVKNPTKRNKLYIAMNKFYIYQFILLFRYSDYRYLLEKRQTVIARYGAEHITVYQRCFIIDTWCKGNSIYWFLNL